MPRPRRARPTPAQSVATASRSVPETKNTSGNDDVAQPRGRGRATRSTGARLSTEEGEAIRAANHSRDAALDRLANEDITTSGTGADDEDASSSVEFGRRAMATPAQRRDTTGLDLADDDVFGDLEDSFGDGDMPGTTRSTETSSLTLSHFKPRSRQSSIIGRNDPPIRPSSRGGNSTPGVSSSFNIGVFRRRAREPSILGTSRKPRAEVTTTTQASDSESEGDFAPEAESTPLNTRRTRAAPDARMKATLDATSKPNSRKRKSEDVQAESTRPEKALRIESDAKQAEDSDSDLSMLDSPGLPPAALIDRAVTPPNLDDPPASSGSEDEDIWPDIHSLAKRRRRPSVSTPVRADHLSDVSSPPSLTHSPNFPEANSAKTRGRATTKRPSPKVTTADLANLLPKRRHRKARDTGDQDSDEEVDNSGLAQDEDELSHLDARAIRRRKGSRQPSRAGRSKASALKPIQAPAATSESVSRNTRARGLRSLDKENEIESEEEAEEESAFQALPDDTFDAGTETMSADELKQAASKFKEVDRWELEFEEVAEPPSPEDAR